MIPFVRTVAGMAQIKEHLVARSIGGTSSICGQATSVYLGLTEKLVEWGITSVSISPGMIGSTREIVAKAEARLNIK